MNKYILLTTLLCISSCGNIHTPEISQIETKNPKNVQHIDNSPEIKQMPKFAEDKIIVHFY